MKASRDWKALKVFEGFVVLGGFEGFESFLTALKALWAGFEGLEGLKGSVVR